MGGSASNSNTTSPSISALTILGSKLIYDSLAASTKATYKGIWRKFSKFCATMQHQHWANLPVSPSAVFLFLTEQIASGISGSTLTTQCSALSYPHKLMSMPDPTAQFAIRKLIISGQKKNPSFDQRMPITLPVLQRLYKTVQMVVPSWYMAELLRTVFLVAYYGFFRVGELIPSSKNNSHKVVQISDVSFQYQHLSSPVSATLHVKSSKNLSPGSSVQVCLVKKESLCPVSALHTFIKSRGLLPGPLFSLPSGSPLIRSQFDCSLKRCVQASGLKGRYLSHSFRIGAATQAALDGVTDSKIRQLGRWRSDAFRRYIRMHAIKQ